MGFPSGYTDLLFPKILVHLLTVLGLMRKTISVLLSFVGLGDFLEPEIIPYDYLTEMGSETRSMSAALIRELLPVVKYSDMIDPGSSESASESESESCACAVCLHEFDMDDEIRRLTNCCHIFHRSCVDRWMDHDQKTCPLCRTTFVPDDMLDAFNERLWLASGISDLYGNYSPITSAFLSADR